MADFSISAVRYAEDRSHIEFVRVHEDFPDRIGTYRVVARAFVADLIRLNKATFQTVVKSAAGKWANGASVHVIDAEYLTTNRNNLRRDNLGNLPEF